MARSDTPARLSFLITEAGFQLDDRGLKVSDAAAKWQDKFRADPYGALYSFGFAVPPESTDAAGVYLHSVASAFIEALTNNPDLEVARGETIAEPDETTVQRLLGSVPFVLGAQYVDEKWLRNMFGTLQKCFRDEVSGYAGSMESYLAEKNQSLKVKERVFFHLVERSSDPDFPFAFLATYSTKGDDGKVRHVPLQYALTEYKQDKPKLLDLLACLNRVQNESRIISKFVSSGEMFHPLRLTSDEAYQILKDIPAIENAGIICRIPNWWRKKSSQFSVTVKVGAKKGSFVGLDSIVSSVPSVTLDGQTLSKAELQKLLAQSDGLAFIKGKWVEVDHEKLRELLDEAKRWGGDLSFVDMLRMNLTSEQDDKTNVPVVVHKEWLAQMLNRLRDPDRIKPGALPKSFNATLRPYQETGFAWLNYMHELGLGALLADDMGLGKTVQVLALLERLRSKNPEARVLLIVPASLIGNWEQEKNRFAPDMPVHILHGKPAPKLAHEYAESNAFLTVTTYGIATRMEQLADREWDCIILDEAQAIKNPKTKQSRQIRQLKGRSRIALTGTPVENDLSNLWAVFDFLDRGLLGSMEEFKKYSSGLEGRPEGYAGLRNMIAPFMLRRMKTDKSIIADLPDKVEIRDYVNFSKKQSALYQTVVDNLRDELESQDGGFQRAGAVLRTLMKLKQICNHPDQYLGQPVSNWKESGKFEMMREICENIAQNRERVLVFTQFREITKYLDEFLSEVFGVKGFVIHGGVSPKKRTEIVDAFQSSRYYPYVVLTVKAGGTGLNLTNANHVIHFDRWWNPAVENQATDRAYRIGQKQDVMVHKLVCRGTIEERIDELIESKKALAENVIGTGEKWITDMSDDELMSLMQLNR